LHYHNSSRSISAHFHHPTMDGSMQLGSARYLYYKVSQQDKNVNTHPRRTLSVSFVLCACAPLLYTISRVHCEFYYAFNAAQGLRLSLPFRRAAPAWLSCAKCLNSYPPTHLSRKRKMIENVSLNSKGKRQRAVHAKICSLP
jgi:hypothetical protein